MADFIQTILNSNNFIEVDRALFGATQLFKEKYPQSDYKIHYIPAFAYESIERAHAEDNLSVKKIWLLTLMVCFPEVAEFAIQNSEPTKMRRTLEWLGKELPAAFGGSYHDQKNRCQALISNTIEYYVSC